MNEPINIVFKWYCRTVVFVVTFYIICFFVFGGDFHIEIHFKTLSELIKKL